MKKANPKRKIIRWEDPPHSRNWGNVGGRPRGSEWDEVAAALRDEPGRWAVVYVGDRRGAMSARTKIAMGAGACFRPQGAFEAAARSWDGVHTVYARYLGD